MKKIQNLKTLAALIIGVLFIVSCEKSDVEETEIDQIVDVEEGFKSTTGSNDEVLDLKSKSNLPVLKMHFDKDVSKEEAMLKFNLAVDSYISKQPVQDKAFSTEWFYRVWTYTGHQSNNDTDGDVGAYIRFTTSKGGYTPPFNWMDNSGDDREGGWDAYLFKASFPGEAVEWVEVDYGRVYLKGTDGWFITQFVVQLWTSDQTLPAQGFSQFWSYPNVWLDNDSGSGWDNYYSGNIGTGRITF